tara:strand:- start:9247 stop:12510 length:3264 start_codon:yes stop_codon:yes gene_type:complete
MGSNITPDYLRGFLIPYGINNDLLWPAQSTYTQQGVRAGTPQPKQSGTGLILESRGDQDQDLDIKTVKGGTAGEGAGFNWKGSTESDYYGGDAVNIPTGFDFWKYSASAASGGTNFSVDAISLSNGTLLTVHENQSLAGFNSVIVTRKKRSASATTTTLFNELLASYEAHPCICELNDGSVLVCHFRQTTTDDITVAVYRSTNEGTSFTRVSTGALDTKIGTTGSSGYIPQKMRMVANDNTVFLVMELLSNDSGSGAQNRIGQFVSFDRGATFKLIGISPSGSSGAHEYHVPDCSVLQDGSFCVAYIKDEQTVNFERLPYGSFDISNSTYGLNKVEVTNTGSLVVSLDPGSKLTDGRLAMWIDNNNVLFIAVGNVTDKSLVLFASYDSGEKWIKMSGDSTISDATFFQPDSTGSEIYRLTACNWEGRNVLIGRHSLSLPLLYLGGYATNNLPSLVTDPRFFEYIRYDNSWIPLQTPQTSSFYTAVGTGADTLSENGLNIVTTAGQTRYLQSTPTVSTLGNGHIVRYRIKMTGGGSTGSDNVAIRIRLDDTSSHDYDVSIRYTLTSFVVYDNNGSAVKNTTSKSMTNETEFIVAMIDGKITILHRDWNENDARVYAQIDITGLSDGGGGGGGYIRWGHLTSPAGNTESNWSEFHTSSDSSTGVQMIGPQSPNYILYPIQGDYVYLNGGTSISTRESPAYENDEYSILRHYDYSIDRVFHDVSPSRKVMWRSESVTSGAIASQVIPFYLDKGLEHNAESRLGSDLVAMHLSNINFRTFKIKRYDVGTSAWVVVATIDTSSGITSTFVRTGNTLKFGGGGVDSFYLNYNECENWRVQLVLGDSTVIRPIETNSEGTWNNNTSKGAVVKLIDVDNTEPASGTCRFIPTDVTVIMSMNGETGSAWALEIDSQETHEKYFEIGSMTFGHVAVVAPSYGRGRSISYEPNTQTFTSLDGTTHTRKLSSGRRIATISWTDGVDISSTFDSDPSPDYWQFSTSGGAEPVANYGDAPNMMIGLYNYLGGPDKPIVYIPSFKKSSGGSSDIVLLNRYHEQLYGRTTGSVSIDHIVGSELIGDNKGEVFRIGSINIREIE